jgi:transcriptional regulator with XRE-family HTH domain
MEATPKAKEGLEEQEICDLEKQGRKAIREMRISAGKSQVELGKELELAQSWISLMEGNVHPGHIRLKTLEKIAELTGFKVKIVVEKK